MKNVCDLVHLYYYVVIAFLNFFIQIRMKKNTRITVILLTYLEKSFKKT